MIAVPCPAEGRTVLLGPRRILAIRTTPERVEVDFHCWCGATGTHTIRRGSRPDARGATTSAPPTGGHRPTADDAGRVVARAGVGAAA